MELPPLLERGTILDRLESTFGQVAEGNGACVLVHGEAGIGKTALVTALVQRIGTRALVLSGVCDRLDTPRPLGVLVDIADRLGPEVHALLDDLGPGPKRFELVSRALSKQSLPVMLVFEDIQWADESTRDLLRFLATRVRSIRMLLVVTCRNDEGSDADPLPVLLGDLETKPVLRIDLQPLTKAAVLELTRNRISNQSPGVHIDAEALHRRTGGNPFFVMEVLAEPSGTMPHSVREVVLGRLLRLPAALQQLARVVSLSPSRCERKVLAAAFPNEFAAAVAEIERGHLTLLVDDGVSIGFRHEIAREAIANSVSERRPATARQWHGRFVQVLQAIPNASPALLAHHATLSGNPTLVVRWCLPAGLEAARLGANREAEKLLGEVLAAGEGLAEVDRLAVIEQYAQACQNALHLPRAVKARQAAIDACVRQGLTVRQGHNLALLGRVYWLSGDRRAAVRSYAAALTVLEPHSDTVEYAWACAHAAGAHMTAEEDEQAIELAGRALKIAENLGATEVRIHALNTLGDAQQYRHLDWRKMLDESLRLALENGFVDHAARAYINLASTAIVAQDYGSARSALADGLAFASERNLDFQRDYLLAWRARERFESGDWAQASADARELQRDSVAPVARIPAYATLAAIAVRQGASSAPELLVTALSQVESTGEHQRIAPVLLAQAEAAWCGGDDAACAGYARAGVLAAIHHGSLDNFGRFAVWLQRAGAADEARNFLTRVNRCPSRFADELSGRWSNAASDWESRGCAFEQALALLYGAKDDVQRAISLLTTLGASAAVTAIRTRRPIRGAPKGPRRSTQGNLYGLTNGEHQILCLMVQGLSYVEIADRLSRAKRTVENHAAAVLSKMGMTTRAKAVAKALRDGIDCNNHRGDGNAREKPEN